MVVGIAGRMYPESKFTIWSVAIIHSKNYEVTSIGLQCDVWKIKEDPVRIILCGDLFSGEGYFGEVFAVESFAYGDSDGAGCVVLAEHADFDISEIW